MFIQPSSKIEDDSLQLNDNEWALIPNTKIIDQKSLVSLYRQTIQMNKRQWFKLYIRKEHLAFNSIYYCKTFNYFGNIEVLPMARNLEGVYRTLNFQSTDNQLFALSNQIILNMMHLDEQLLFFCVESQGEAAFEIEILCKHL